jgi:uncharacterized protein with von Willebrand factor type A (vWA) domain
MSNKAITNPGPVDGGLAARIARFADLLRASGAAVSLPAVLDTLKGLAVIDVLNPAQFKCLLQVSLICRKEDLAIFNQLYYGFWHAKNRTVRNFAAAKNQTPQLAENSPFNRTGDMTRLLPGSAQEPEAGRQRSILYSPESAKPLHPTKDIRFAESRAVYETICKLLQPLRNRQSRRFHHTIRGKQIDLRNILRKNMQFGGELIFLGFKKKKVKKRRVVFLCDVSGSMDVYTLLMLQFIHALKRIDRRTEIFFFATDLFRGTSEFELNEFTSAVSRIHELISDWGGGTRIGRCLERFNKNYGQRMLCGRDVVIIFSDGWDRGEIDELDSQMATLKRKSHKIIWLNPLLGTRGYQPICQGMRTALPYVDHFLPMGALQDLRLLNRTLDQLLP